MKYIILFLPFFLFADTSFITEMEYARELYKNPRGIGCQKCHGLYGEGKVIAKYIHKGKEKVFKAPAINKIDYATFYKVLNRRNRSMPRYFLVKEEIKALYFYLHQINKKKKK